MNAPAGRRISRLVAEMRQAGGPPAPATMAEVQRLQRRLGGASTIVAIMLMLAVALMAVARYVG